MADVQVATTDSFTTKLSGASVDDTMVMADGEHVTPSSGTARENVNKRVIVRATQASYPSWAGKYVKDSTGHSVTDWTSRWRGGWTFGANSIEVQGMLFDGRMSGGPGHVSLEADSLVFNDCGFTDGFRYIHCHAEGAGVSDILFNRCRFWDIGSRSGHDHPIYWKDTNNSVGRCRAVDCIFYNSTGWAMHAYPSGDDVLYLRCLVYKCNSAGVFSSEGGSSTSGAGFEDCLLVDAQGYDVGGYEDEAYPRYLVEENGGTGYITDTMAVNNDPGTGIIGVVESSGNITETNVTKTGTPLWLNGPPSSTGDFRLAGGSNPAAGFGPSYIQFAGTTYEETGKAVAGG